MLSHVTQSRLPRSALPALRRADPALGRLIARVGPYRLQSGYPEGHLAALVRAIVFQQLSRKAAETIYGRLRALFPPAPFPTPAQLLLVSEAELRNCGLSNQKLGYLRDLSARAADGRLALERLASLDDEEVIAQLTTVRGIGRWSAEMFLLFHLGRLDVWPVDDLGIRKASMYLHGRKSLPSADELHDAGARYRPYRSVASWYLWRLLDLPEAEWTTFAA